MKNIRIYLKIFLFLVVKFSICLNRRVFVMKQLNTLAVISFVDVHCSEKSLYLLKGHG